MLIKRFRSNEKPDIYYEFDQHSNPLGEGGMGCVYLGYCVTKTEGRYPVAIKCIKDGLPASAIERARREASVRLHNDNLIEMLDFIEVDDRDVLGQPVKRYYVVSELLLGVTLDSMLEGNTNDQLGNSVKAANDLYQIYKTNKFRFAQTITVNILQSLIALHGYGYIHRDIDPTNIMICQDGRIKLIDYGIAKQINKSYSASGKGMTSLGEFIGKAIYAPPELILGDVNHQDATTDLYAVGAMMYHLLLGEPPFKGAHREVTEAHLHKKFPVNNIPHALTRDIIRKACAKKQSDRYYSAVAFLADVEKLKYSAYPDTVTPMMKYSLAGVGALAIVCVGLLIMSISNREPSVEAQPAEATYAQACSLLAQEDTFSEGFTMLRQVANTGDPDAIELLSDLYINTSTGQGNTALVNAIKTNADGKIKPDSIRAHKMHAALVQREPTFKSYTLMAEDFIKGIGVNPNQQKAEHYIQLASSKSSSDQEQSRVEYLNSLCDQLFGD